MAKISALKLDPETRDLCFDADGIMEVVEDGNAIAQNIRNNLLTWKGEFPLNTGHGTEWQRVMGRPISEAQDEADDVLRASIFQEPYVKEIDPDLHSLQAEVGGDIGATYPYSDPVALVCNDEGKLIGLDLNRGLRDENGEIYDIVAGTFFGGWTW